MRQLQVDIDSGEEEARKILENYSSDVTSSSIEKNGGSFTEFSVTADQSDIDEISEKLKGLEVESGDLSIRVIDQESLIEKGVQTRGPSTQILSSQEVYSKAQKASTFNKAQWGMTGLSGALAGIGLSTGNLIVLLGAILLAPALYPLAALSTSIRMGDRKMALKSSRTSFLSIFSIFVFSMPVFLILGGASINVLVEGLELLLLSAIVGGAAMLTFISEYREEMAGAAVAVAIVPPAALAGDAVVGLSFSQAVHSVQVLTVNVLTVVLSGYGILVFSGAGPFTDYRLRDAEKLKFVVLGMILSLIVVMVALL
ncbi:MAG: TIGR00341 family protein [Candidatus Nanohaloarchaea archaeon]